MASTGSSFDASMVWVAPIFLAASNLVGLMSTAMMGTQPLMAAPLTAQRPMPPHPKTARLSPARGLAELKITPRPVGIAQPRRAASFMGKSLGRGVSRFSLMMEYLLKVVTAPALTLRPFQSKMEPMMLAPD